MKDTTTRYVFDVEKLIRLLPDRQIGPRIYDRPRTRPQRLELIPIEIEDNDDKEEELIISLTLCKDSMTVFGTSFFFYSVSISFLVCTFLLRIFTFRNLDLSDDEDFDQNERVIPVIPVIPMNGHEFPPPA